MSGTAPMADDRKRAAKLRCAIYTRKSSEEGLEQEFNSLQAQREACEAFIASQKSEGWQALPTAYDDGGWSGGTLDRPALQRLLADIRASKVDVVVVYKIDRLTRSLFDFAKIVEVFDAHGVSFVSVTQAFNTTTSMGRLTLNVLLSFAQFEREVTGERIRDKIAASKKKGMWMGGFVPLGYDAKDRKLIINEEEAESVRYHLPPLSRARLRLQIEGRARRQGHHQQAAHQCQWQSLVAGGRSQPVRSTSCCRTRSTAAGSATRAKSMKVSTRPSSSLSCGKRCSDRLPSIAAGGAMGRTSRSPACSPA